MSVLLHLCIAIPLLGFLVSVVIPRRHERLLSRSAFFTAALQGGVVTSLTTWWVVNELASLDIRTLVLLELDHYQFFIAFRFDKITAVYALIGAVLTSLVMVYSGTYLHREAGYKRFFNNTLFFYFGYSLVVFAGNMETLFIGWEILGIASFLLIAFYRHRYLPVKNAVKVFSIYRIGDVGLLLAIWMSHHLWRQNIGFEKLYDYGAVHTQLQSHTLIGVFISLMILLSAAAKSAQLPFSSWLPRAMEGPTPSSAIFYGSLSVHIGVFLLLRTFPFWAHQFSVRILIGSLGLVTSIIASGIARVQSTVKSQIAYGSIAQIGIIFMEVALGWLDVALFHFAGNAFLRTYQLLVSPSAVTYLIRDQFYNFIPRQHTFEDSLPRKIEYSLYVLSLKEWNLDTLMYRYLWNPLKRIGNRLSFLTSGRTLAFMIPLLIVGYFCVFVVEEIHSTIQLRLPGILGVIALACSLKALTERTNVKLSWGLIIMSHLWIALAISINETFVPVHTLIYLSGVLVAGIGGWVCLRLLRLLEKQIDLDRFNGHAYLYPRLAFVFLVCCLGLAGFPITPTFIGEDLILTHIHEHQFFLALTWALSFIINGLAIVRIYARIFLGPYIRSPHEMAYRSS